MSFATFRTLHTIIGDALTELEGIYHQQPLGKLDYPALDVPYYATAQYSAEVEAAEKLARDPTVVTASKRIVAACGQLTASLHHTFYSLIDGIMSGNMPACMRFLEASNTVEILRAAGPNGLHTSEIARRIAETNTSAKAVDPVKLSHILRYLATHHWLREVAPEVFANNRLSALIDTGKTPEDIHNLPENKHNDTDGVAALVAFSTDEFAKSIAHLTDALLPDGARASTIRALRDKESKEAPPTPYVTPFNVAFRTQAGYFEWLELPENKLRLSDFGRGMTGARAWEVAENIIGVFPWGELKKDAVVFDVGGGVGSTSVVLASAFPHLRLVVQDRKQVIEIAPKVWEGANAELIKSGRVSFQPQDFFMPQLASVSVPGVGEVSAADVFVLRGCTHNWPDAAVLKMLGHLRTAAAPHTQLLIIDVLLPFACTVTSTAGAETGDAAVHGATPPLLANLGRASTADYNLDISMMAVLDARERTRNELEALANQAGWRFVRVVRPKGTLWGYITAAPA